MTVFFTSDPHWGHRKVAELRGFSSTEEHDEALIDSFRSVVRKGDQVWWLGDLAMNSPSAALAHTTKIPGEHHLIFGNHDKGHPMHRGAWKWHDDYLIVFRSVGPYARRRIAGEEVLLSHFPYATTDGQADRGEVRETQYRLPDEGRWLLHGHTHMEGQRRHGRQIHVGLDAWGLRPVDLDTIAALMHDDQ